MTLSVEAASQLGSAISAAINSEYREMSATDLARRINASYEEILSSERTNLPRAMAIGEKLVWLNAKTDHGEWKKKLSEWCPKLKYETANRYMRLYTKWPIIEKRAADKNVVTTSLTIEDALDLISKPRKPEADPNEPEAGSDEPKSEENEPKTVKKPKGLTEEEIGKEWLKALAVDELVIWLSGLHDEQYLTELRDELTELLKPQPKQPAMSGVGAALANAGSRLNSNS
jgi:hypothetical protein